MNATSVFTADSTTAIVQYIVTVCMYVFMYLYVFVYVCVSV